MSITSSVFSLGYVQADGRRYVTETHSDAQGVAAVIEYLANVGANYTTIMNARAAALNVSLADAEAVAAVLKDVGALSLRFQTITQLIAKVRATYRPSSGNDCAALARWIVTRITNGTTTDAQWQSAFALSSGQYSTLKSKWTTLASNYNGVQTAVGE